MKRKSLLAITGCTPKAFETYSARGKLPFSIGSERWSDYTMENALQLKLMMMASSLTSLDNASLLAAWAPKSIGTLDLFSAPDFFIALVSYKYPCRVQGERKVVDRMSVVVGRWGDIEEKANDRIKFIDQDAKISGVIICPLSDIAREICAAAEQELGMAQA